MSEERFCIALGRAEPGEGTTSPHSLIVNEQWREFALNDRHTPVVIEITLDAARGTVEAVFVKNEMVDQPD